MSTIYQPYLIVTSNYNLVRIFINPENSSKKFTQLVEENKKLFQDDSVLLSPVKNTRYFESFDYNLGYDKSEMFAINLNLIDTDYSFEEYFIKFVFQEEKYREALRKNFISKKSAEIDSLGVSAGGSVFKSDNDLLKEAQQTIKSKLTGYIYFIFGINDRPSSPIVSQFYKAEVTQSSDGFKKLKLNFINLGHPYLISELAQIGVDRSNFKVIEGENFKKYEMYKYEDVISYSWFIQNKLINKFVRHVLRNLFTSITGQEVILLLPDFDVLYEKFKKSYVPKGFLRVFTTNAVPGNNDLSFLNSEFYKFLTFTEYMRELGFTISEPLFDSGSVISQWLDPSLIKSGSGTFGNVPPEAVEGFLQSIEFFDQQKLKYEQEGLTQREVQALENLRVLGNLETDLLDDSRNFVGDDWQALDSIRSKGKGHLIKEARIQKKKLELSLNTLVYNSQDQFMLKDFADLIDKMGGRSFLRSNESRIEALKLAFIEAVQNQFSIPENKRANEQDWSDLNFVSGLSPTGKKFPIEFYIIEKGEGTSELDKLMPQKGNHINYEKFISEFSNRINKIDQNFDMRIGFFEENDLSRLNLLKNTCAYENVSSFYLEAALTTNALRGTLTVTATNPTPPGFPTTGDYGPINRSYETLREETLSGLSPNSIKIKGLLTETNPPQLRNGQNVNRITLLNTVIQGTGVGPEQVTITRREAVYDQYDLDNFIFSKLENTQIKAAIDQNEREAQEFGIQAEQVRQQLRNTRASNNNTAYLVDPEAQRLFSIYSDYQNLAEQYINEYLTINLQIPANPRAAELLQLYNENLRLSREAYTEYTNYLSQRGNTPDEENLKRVYQYLIRQKFQKQKIAQELLFQLLEKERRTNVRILTQTISREEYNRISGTGRGLELRDIPVQQLSSYNSSIWTWDGLYLPDELAPGLSRIITDETRPVIVIGEEWLVKNLYYPVEVPKNEFGNYPICEEDILNYGPNSRYSRNLQRRKNHLAKIYKKNFLNSSFNESVIDTDVLDYLSQETKELAVSSLLSVPVFVYNFKNSNILSYNLEVDKLNHTFSYHNLINFQKKGVINDSLRPLRSDIYDKLINVSSLYQDLDTFLTQTPNPLDVDSLIDFVARKIDPASVTGYDAVGNEISLDFDLTDQQLPIADDLAKSAELTRAEFVQSIANKLVDDFLSDMQRSNPKVPSLIKGTDLRLNPIIKRLQFLKDLYTKMYNLSIKTLPFFDINNMERMYSGSIVVIKNIPSVISTPREQLSYLTGLYRIKGFKHVITTNSAYSEFTLFKDPTVGQIEL